MWKYNAVIVALAFAAVAVDAAPTNGAPSQEQPVDDASLSKVYAAFPITVPTEAKSALFYSIKLQKYALMADKRLEELKV